MLPRPRLSLGLMFTASGIWRCTSPPGTMLPASGWAERKSSSRALRIFPPFPTLLKRRGAQPSLHAKHTHDVLIKTVEALPDSRLRQRVPGKRYDFYLMLHGVAQHALYHAGQIAILKKAQARGQAAK